MMSLFDEMHLYYVLYNYISYLLILSDTPKVLPKRGQISQIKIIILAKSAMVT